MTSMHLKWCDSASITGRQNHSSSTSNKQFRPFLHISLQHNLSVCHIHDHYINSLMDEVFGRYACGA